MTEETAIRIAEALENIEGDARAFIALFVGFAFAVSLLLIGLLICSRNEEKWK